MSKMKLLWNIFNTLLFFITLSSLACVVYSSSANGEQKRCRRDIGDCPSDCSSTMDAKGCFNCQCGVSYYRAPRLYCPKIKCPSECGLKKNAMGCPTCYCDLNSYYRRPLSILKLRPTIKQLLAKALEAKRRERYQVPSLNSIVH